MRSLARHARALLVLTLSALGCAPACTVKTTTRAPDRPAADSARRARPDTRGRIPLTLVADGAVAPGPDEIVSLGVPFPPGVLRSTEGVRVLDAAGAEVPAHVEVLAIWPRDRSLRSVLVAFRATVPARKRVRWTIDYLGAAGPRAEPMAARPDGPVIATLPPAWYARSQVIGPQVPAARNRAFADWEAKLERGLVEMDPPWRSYGRSCDRMARERTYYDAPHALFQRFIRRGTAASYRRAREEALWYRQNNLAWHEDGQVAVYSCASGWDRARPMAWSLLRNMLGQGMLDDYLLTGDAEAARALRGLGEAYLRNLPALSGQGRTERALTVTERNLAWPLMGLASYYALDPRPDVASALGQLVGLAVVWQEEGTSGAFEHDIRRPAPEECGRGPKGASPFMTSLLIDGLMDAWVLTGDPRIPPVVLRAAAWFRDHAFVPEQTAFLYLWGCEDRDYRAEDTSDLNLLMVHVFGAAYHLSRDEAWLDFGDRVARHGIARMYVGAPKQWNQAMRSFSRYMGYRARARTP